MAPRFESRPILSRRAHAATLQGTVALEWRPQAVTAVHLFCIIAASVVARGVANQEVLDAFGPSSLGSLYVVVALLAGALLAGLGWVSRGHEIREVTTLTHLASAALMVLAALLPPSLGAAALGKYVLMEVSAAALLLVFGRVLGSRFAPRDARRIAARVGAGGILGGLAGGAVLSVGAHLVGSRWLFLAAAAIVLVPLGWAGRIEGRAERASPLAPDGEPSRTVARYGRAVAMTTLVMVATTTLVDYVFRSGAKALYRADELTAFFGHVALLTGVVAIVFQLAVVDRLLERLGVFATAAVMPAALALCGAAFGAVPLAATLVAFKLADSGTNMTVQQATSSLLLAPLDARARAVWQGRIDGLARRGGQALAGVFLVAFPWQPDRILPLTIALCVAWLVALASTRGRYIRLLTEMVRGGGAAGRRVSIEDGDTVRLLEAELEHASPGRAAVILDLMAGAGRRASTRTLERMAAEDGAAPGALLAVEHLARLGDSGALAGYVAHPRVEVAVRALAAVAEIDLQAAQALARRVLDEAGHAEAVRACASGILGESDRHALELARGHAGGTDATTREAVALGLALTPPSSPASVGDMLTRLASDRDDSVAVRALGALPRHATPEGIEVAVAALARPGVRGAAMRALAGVGPLAAERISQELASKLEAPRIASALAWVLGRLGGPAAVGALLESLWARHPEVRLAGAIALGSVRRHRPGTVIPLNAVSARYRPEIEYYAGTRDAGHVVPAQGPAGRLLRRLLRQRAQASLECLFRLLALRYPEDAIRSTLLGVSSGDRRQRQLALELLDTVLEPELRAALAAALSDTASRRRGGDVQAFVGRLAREADPFLAALARRVLGELGAPAAGAAAPEPEITMGLDLVRDVLELQAVSLFSQSSAEDLAELATRLVDRAVRKGTVVFAEGDLGDALYLVRSGRVTLSRGGEVVEQLGPGDAFGVVAVLDQQAREVTAVAATDATLRVLAGDDLMQLLGERPLFMHSLFRALTGAIRGQLDRLALAKHTDVA